MSILISIIIMKRNFLMIWYKLIKKHFFQMLFSRSPFCIIYKMGRLNQMSYNNFLLKF